MVLSAVVALFVVYAPSSGRCEPPAKPIIHAYAFSGESCPDCARLKDEMKKIASGLGATLIIQQFNVDDVKEYRRLIAMEERYGKGGDHLPVVFVGSYVLGSDDPVQRLDSVFRELVAEGGSAELDVRGVTEGEVRNTEPVYLAYFDEPGCQKCARADKMLRLLQVDMPGLQVRRFAVTRRNNTLLLAALAIRAGVPKDSILTVPAVFVGRGKLAGKDLGDSALRRLVLDQGAAAAQQPWEATSAELAAAENYLVGRFRGIGLVTVFVGGLVDSINPCAFATLIFFVGYVKALGRSASDVLAVGLCFVTGVMAAYFCIGLGLSEALLRLDAVPLVSAVVRWLIVGMAFCLAALSFRDALLARKGRHDGMALRLPGSVRLKINRLIAKRLHTPTIALAALGLGLTVSLLELVCTGQIYLPLVRFMNSVSVDRWRTVGLLAAYNVAFVLPLVGICGIFAAGRGSDWLGSQLKRRTALLKVLMGMFLLALAALLAVVTSADR